jgi:conjugal transfer mating pair stabilization protein TraG
MSAFTIVVYGNADLYRECLNAIASVVGTTEFNTLLKLTTCLAFSTVLFSFTFKQDVMLVFKWFALFYVVFYILFVPKVTVNIEDRVSVGTSISVDNVPFGLAVMASYTSIIGDTLTQKLESTFSLPDDLRYSQSGMVMASKMVVAANKFEITNSEFNHDMMEFSHRCIFYDLLMHRYSIDNLLGAENTWEFIKANTSKANAFALDGEVVSCIDGAKILSEKWNEIINQVAHEYGARLFSQSNKPEEDLKARLISSYRFLIKDLASSAEILFSQHLIKNVIDRGIIHMDGSLDAQAALQTYAITRADDQLRATFASVGELVGEWIAYFKNAIEIIAYALFIFVVLLSIFPAGNKILINYLIMLFWLQLWAPFFAIINLIVSFYAKSNTSVFAGVTLHSISAILDSNRNMAGIAGYMSLLVPVLSWKLLNGMNGVFDHIAHGFSGYLQSSVATGVGEATSGNFSFGNTSFANHNSDNNSQFKWDTSGRFSSGILQSQLSNGSNMTNTPSGRAFIDSRGTISNLGTDVDLTRSIRESSSKQAENSTQTAFSQSRESGESFMGSSRDLYQFEKMFAKTEGSGTQWTSNSSSSAMQAYRDAMQQTQRFADDNRISFGDAAKILSAANTDLKAGVQLGFGVPFTKIGGGVGANASKSWGGDVSSHVDHSSLMDKAKSYVKDSGYSDNIDAVERAVKDQSLRTNDEKANRLLDASSLSYDHGNSYRTSAQNSLQQAKSYRESANNAEEIASSYRMNFGQSLAEYIAKQPHPSGDGPITFGRLGDVANDAGLMKRYAEGFVRDNIDHFKKPLNHDLPHSKSDVEHTYEKNNHQINIGKASKEQYKFDQTDFSKKANIEIGEVNVDYERKRIVENQIAKDKEKLSHHKEDVNSQGHDVVKKWEAENARKRAEKHPVDNMIKGIDTKNYDE